MLCGKGYVTAGGDYLDLFTSPFFPSGSPLSYRPPCVAPTDGAIESGGRLLPLDRSMKPLVQGTLVYDEPHVDMTTQFIGTETFHAKLGSLVDSLPSLSPRLVLTGNLPAGNGPAVRHESSTGSLARRAAYTVGLGPLPLPAVPATRI